MAKVDSPLDDTIVKASSLGVQREAGSTSARTVELYLSHSETEDGGDGRIIELTLTHEAAVNLAASLATSLDWHSERSETTPKDTAVTAYQNKRQAWISESGDHYIQHTGDPKDSHFYCIQRITPGSGIPGVPYGPHLSPERLESLNLRKNGRF